MHLHSLTPKRARAGLTLVEMLIALALSIFIMAIMSEAFVKGLEAFGQYKALADLEQRLRTVANILRRDLRANHFEGNKKLSECTESGKAMPALDGLLANTYNINQAKALHRQLAPYRLKAPQEGFFCIEEWPNRPGSPDRVTSVYEGQDASFRPSYRDQYDVLHFTSRLEGNDPDKFFYGRTRAGSLVDGAGVSAGATRYDSAANGMYTSQAAELLYFLDTDETANLPGVNKTGGPVLTFNLYRQAWLLVPNRFSDGSFAVSDNTYATNTGQYAVENDVSAVNVGGTFYYNSMADVQHRARRVGTNPGALAATIARSPKFLAAPTTTPIPLSLREGSDILLTNVISFDVKVFDPFAYKLPLDATNLGSTIIGPFGGRGAYVDIGDTVSTIINPNTGLPYNPRPTAAAASSDELVPAFGNKLNFAAKEYFDTGTARYEGLPGAGTALTPADSPTTHPYPFTSIQITIRVFEPKSKQTRQITIIQDM